MKRKTLSDTRAHRAERRRCRLVTAMACVVAFCTVYALILPAITLEQTECGKTEHTHTVDCYTQLTSVSRSLPVCSAQGLQIHSHTDACRDGAGNLICGYADFVVHQHDASCYDGEGTLWCTLTEIEVHTHGSECYSAPEAVEAHTHTDGCYTLTRGELTCTEHVHSDECYTENRELICTLEECDGHRHDDSCREETGELVCGQEESDGHHHDEGCFEVHRELSCGIPGDHTHTDECYAQIKILICDLPTEPAEEAAPAQPVLICGKPEVILHEHTSDCFDETGSLICGQVQVLRHQHTDACFETVEEPADTEALTCTSTDPEHVHGPLCYGSWVLTCELEEHTHSEECLQASGGEETPDGALTQDGAVVSELKVDAVAENGDSLPWMVRSGQSAVYRVNAKTASLTDASYTQGRVKLELVLPLSADEAVFDLSSMSWLDQTEGYAPQITQETRVFGEEALPCQVLTGYKPLTAIPGEFSEDIVIEVVGAAPEKTAALQVSAAMEHNQWDGDCEIHQMPEKLTVTALGFMAVCSEEEAKGFYAQYLAEVEALEAAPDTGAAEALMERLRQAYQQGQLTQEGYAQLYERVFTLLYGSPDTIAEQAVGSNWMLLRDSGWFEAYSSYVNHVTAVQPARAFRAVAAALVPESQKPSDVQVRDRGGTNANPDDGVSVSKTIAGTELENVFDITLRVQTNQKISEITSAPDMAVVIVLDISNTMNSNFGGVTRYAAAMAAADSFLDQFAAHNALGTSKVGFVAFNTDARQIFGLQSCANQAKANALKDIMRTRTGNIINAAGYDASHSRFTNIEAGLAMASDMLSGVSSKNKFIVFLSDGFPTTYVSSGYSGYDPYDSTGDRFYDHVLRKPCSCGTSYSDMAAFMAQSKAAAIKGSGTTIFSIGVDVGGQTIQKYITQSEGANGYSVVDRTGTTYEIGDANSSASYKNWLRDKIGSGYYYDSTDSSGLSSAFDHIFAEIKRKVTEASKADWVAVDPMPSGSVEFIRFYNQSANLTPGSLTGTSAENAENTASFDGGQNAIAWDLKHSGYQMSSSGASTTYTYQLVYRVRLENELDGFGEGTVYRTNGQTTLRYRVVRTVDNSTTISDPKTLAFPIPSVQGFLSELTFTKQNSSGAPLQGAEFTLRHDSKNCNLCRGDETSVAVAEKSAASGADGAVIFTGIPSGHRYTLTETKAPDGYAPTGNTYQVTVAYDKITVDVKDVNGGNLDWDGTVTNTSYYALPNTGGAGTTLYTMGGCLLLAGAVYLLLYSRIRRRKEDSASF